MTMNGTHPMRLCSFLAAVTRHQFGELWMAPGTAVDVGVTVPCSEAVGLLVLVELVFALLRPKDTGGGPGIVNDMESP